MSLERIKIVNQELGEKIRQNAVKIEKAGVVVSVVLMGSAFFFPEKGMILPAASVAVAITDLVFKFMTDSVDKFDSIV